ncbi:MAG: DNA repair exonuclease [Deltaproteobacteria bacterium]|nr:DNA repair exonuclease [Deltaproteobacteria bacterium]
MPSFSFVHISDTHLDSPFSGFSLDNPDLASVMRSATFEAFDGAVRLCLEEEVDFLLVAGDVYDGADRGLRAQVRFRDGLKALDEAGIFSFVVHGNHDPLTGWSSTLDWPSRTHVFRDRVDTVRVEREGVPLACVQGISYRETEERRNLARLFTRTGPLFHIGLLHANVGSDTGHEPYAPCTLEDLLRADMDYWALGHVHRRRVLAEDLPLIVYPGNTQGRNIRETGARGCYLVRIDERGDADIRFHETDVIRWAARECPIQDLDSEQGLLDRLAGLCRDLSREESGRPVIVRITLTGSGPLHSLVGTPDAREDLREILRESAMSLSPFVWVEGVADRTGPEMDLAGWARGEDFLGELLRCAREVREDRRLDDLSQKELSLLYGDPRVRRFLDAPDPRRLRTLLEKAEEICAEGLKEGGDP